MIDFDDSQTWGEALREVLAWVVFAALGCAPAALVMGLVWWAVLCFA